jgi:hypothetical protein
MVFLGLVVVFAMVVASVVVMMLARSPEYERQLRLPLRGAAAAIVTSILLLGALAGNTRRCMPSLDWGIMFGQVEFELLVGGFVLPIIVLPLSSSLGGSLPSTTSSADSSWLCTLAR